MLESIINDHYYNAGEWLKKTGITNGDYLLADTRIIFAANKEGGLRQVLADLSAKSPVVSALAASAKYSFGWVCTR